VPASWRFARAHFPPVCAALQVEIRGWFNGLCDDEGRANRTTWLQANQN
jgi:hypothetical protein